MRVAVAALEDVPVGALRRVTVDGLPPLVLGNADGTIFALVDECNHGEASLSEGELCGYEIVCPLHSGCFDVRTGKATRRPTKRPQTRFAVEVEDDVVFASPATSDPLPGQSDVGLATTLDRKDQQ